jgi:hypothetical protein
MRLEEGGETGGRAAGKEGEKGGEVLCAGLLEGK